MSADTRRLAAAVATLRLSVDRAALAAAFRRRDVARALSLVNWVDFEAALRAAGVSPTSAAHIVFDAQAGLRAAIRAGTVEPAQGAVVLGLTAREVDALGTYRAQLIAAGRAGQGAAVAARARALLGSSLAPRAKSVHAGRPDYLHLDRIATAAEPGLATPLRTALGDLRARALSSAVARAIEADDSARVLRALGLADLEIPELEDRLLAAAARGGSTAARSLGRQLGLAVPFHGADDALLSWGETLAEELRAWLRDSAERAALKILEATADLPTATRAAVLAQRIGMPPRSAGAFDPANPLGDKLGVRQALTDRVHDFAERQSYGAVQEGQLQAWHQAERAGVIAPGAEQIWVTRGDDDVCYRCDPLDAQRRKLGEPFTSIGAPELVIRNPGDPHRGWRTVCRCARLIVAVAG